MYEFIKSKEAQRLLDITKSDSGVSGPVLAKAHIRLGEMLGEQIGRDYPSKETTVVALLRGGIFFAQGIYFSLGCRFQTYDPKLQPFEKPTTKHCILVDSVIHSGRTLMPILEPSMDVACCVIHEGAVASMEDLGRQLYALRCSSNAFVGSPVKTQSGQKGPDTTLRLFHQL